MSKLADYPFEIRPLSASDGGGYLISYPDFAECISDGESVEEAIENGRDALKATIAALKANKMDVPEPNSGGVASGKFVARVPRTVHARLATRAKAEGVSLNALLLAFIAEGLGAGTKGRPASALREDSIRRLPSTAWQHPTHAGQTHHSLPGRHRRSGRQGRQLRGVARCGRPD